MNRSEHLLKVEYILKRDVDFITDLTKYLQAIQAEDNKERGLAINKQKTVGAVEISLASLSLYQEDSTENNY